MKSKTKKRATKATNITETDGAYFLKLVLYVIVGSLWLKLSTPFVLGPLNVAGLPVGMILGLLFASHDHFQVDRKIEYAILVIVTAASYYLPMGIVL